jgi:enoyl-CoA hydratase/carnithine racemase
MRVQEKPDKCGFPRRVGTRPAAERPAAVSPRSMRVIKRQLWEGRFQTLAEAIESGDQEMAASFESEDFREGVAHYVEKRKPAFTGR